MFNAKIDRLIESERLFREGATLKNVAENMRTLMVCVAMLLATGALTSNPYLSAKVVATIWAVWTLVVTVLAALQAGQLFLQLVEENAFPLRIRSLPAWAVTSIAMVVATTALCFIVGAVLLVLSSFGKYPLPKP